MFFGPLSQFLSRFSAVTAWATDCVTRSTRDSSGDSSSFELSRKRLLWTSEDAEHGQHLLPHEHGKGNEMKALQHIGQPLLVSGQPPEPAHPAKVPFDHPPARQQHEAALDGRQFDDLQGDAVIGCRLPRHLAGIPLIDVGKRHRLAGGLLHRRRQLADLVAILLGGGRDVQCQEVPQGIDSQVDLGPLAPFRFVPLRPIAALRRTLQGTAGQTGPPRGGSARAGRR